MPTPGNTVRLLQLAQDKVATLRTRTQRRRRNLPLFRLFNVATDPRGLVLDKLDAWDASCHKWVELTQGAYIYVDDKRPDGTTTPDGRLYVAVKATLRNPNAQGYIDGVTIIAAGAAEASCGMRDNTKDYQVLANQITTVTVEAFKETMIDGQPITCNPFPCEWVAKQSLYGDPWAKTTYNVVRMGAPLQRDVPASPCTPTGEPSPIPQPEPSPPPEEQPTPGPGESPPIDTPPGTPPYDGVEPTLPAPQQPSPIPTEPPTQPPTTAPPRKEGLLGYGILPYDRLKIPTFTWPKGKLLRRRSE